MPPSFTIWSGFPGLRRLPRLHCFTSFRNGSLSVAVLTIPTASTLTPNKTIHPQEKIPATNSTTKTDDTVNVPASDVAIRTLPLYSSTSSIGSIDNQSSIRVKNTGKVTEASYALRVNGDSMSPEYADGDILIIKEQDTVSSGELCIYICDGHGYFRKYSEDKLVSLNTQYPNVDIADFKEAKCVGLVLGRLRSKKN